MDGQRGAATGNKFVKHDGRRSTITAFNTTLNTIQRERENLPRDHRDQVSWTIHDDCITRDENLYDHGVRVRVKIFAPLLEIFVPKR